MGSGLRYPTSWLSLAAGAKSRNLCQPLQSQRYHRDDTEDSVVDGARNDGAAAAPSGGEHGGDDGEELVGDDVPARVDVALHERRLWGKHLHVTSALRGEVANF